MPSLPSPEKGVTGLVDSRVEAEYLCSAMYKDVSSLVNPSILVNRRSFRAVGESCVINLIPDPGSTEILGNADHLYPKPVICESRVYSRQWLSRKGRGRMSTPSSMCISQGESG